MDETQSNRTVSCRNILVELFVLCELYYFELKTSIYFHFNFQDFEAYFPFLLPFFWSSSSLYQWLREELQLTQILYVNPSSLFFRRKLKMSPNKPDCPIRLFQLLSIAIASQHWQFLKAYTPCSTGRIVLFQYTEKMSSISLKAHNPDTLLMGRGKSWPSPAGSIELSSV